MGMQKTQYDMALEQFQKAADIMKLDPNVQEILRKPRRILSINFPVKMDDGRILLYQGFRSQHNNALGPYKGGIRYHPNVTIEARKEESQLIRSSCPNTNWRGSPGHSFPLSARLWVHSETYQHLTSILILRLWPGPWMNIASYTGTTPTRL